MDGDKMADKCRLMSERGGPIPGLIFRIPTEKLKAHLLKRAEHHTDRAKTKVEEVPKMEESLAALRESADKVKGIRRGEGAINRGHSNTLGKGASSYGFSPGDDFERLQAEIDSLRSDANNHEALAATFTFLADSLFDGVYTLEWSELVRLEIAKN
jgi:hypothetical protein